MAIEDPNQTQFSGADIGSMSGDNANSAGAVPGAGPVRKAAYMPGLSVTDPDAFFANMQAMAPGAGRAGRFNVPLFGDVGYSSGLENFSKWVKQESAAGRFETSFINRYGNIQDTFGEGGRINRTIEYPHPTMGTMVLPAGSTLHENFAAPQQIQLQRQITAMGMINQGANIALSPMMHPSYTPGADIASGLGGMAVGGGLMAAQLGLITGPVGMGIAAAGMAIGTGADFYRSQVAPLGESIGTAAQLERPAERLGHLGFGSMGIGGTAVGGLRGYAGRYGYGTQEAAHVLSEFGTSSGLQFSAADMRQGGLGDLPFEADLQGISRGTVGFYARNAQVGGAFTGGKEAVNQAIRTDIDVAKGMGLRGGGITEYLQRISATVEGIGQRGLKIQEGVVGNLASTISANAVAAAGGDVRQAYGYGNRAAELAGNVTQFVASSSNMLDVPGTSTFGKGVLLSMAAQRATSKGRPGQLGTQLELEDITKDPKQYMDALMPYGKDVTTQTLKTTAGFSAHEAEAYYEGSLKRKAGTLTGKEQQEFEELGKKLEKAGAGQDVTKSVAENEAKLIGALSDLTSEIKKLNEERAAALRARLARGGEYVANGPIEILTSLIHNENAQ